MIQVNNQYITADEKDILIELRKQLDLKGIKRFAKIIVSGDNIQTNCPFHHEGQERKPSFGILIKQKGKEDAGTCHCFACGWIGSFAEMVSNVFGYDDLGVYGAKWLVRNFLTVQVENRPDILDDPDYMRKSLMIHPVDKPYITEPELDKFRQYHPYMWKRKMTPEVVELFDIGYDKDTNCITFPVRDEYGNCVFVARRSVVSKFFNYPQNAEKPVYGLYELNCISKHTNGVVAYPEEVIICESMIDAITCWVYGKYAVALNGLGNDLQFKQLRHMPNRKFILATDMDSAGQKARQRLKKQLNNKLVSEYIWDVNMAKDINDMSQEQFLNLKEYML
jgi:DNA primase